MPITEVEGRRVKLTHLDRVLWPRHRHHQGASCSTTTRRVAASCSRTRASRLVSFVRTPDGVDGQRFFQKRPPAGTPEWVTVTERVRSSGELMEQVRGQRPAPPSMWAGNLACVEIHTPQWRAAAPDVADRLVLDLDPGEGSTVVDCCRVALRTARAARRGRHHGVGQDQRLQGPAPAGRAARRVAGRRAGLRPARWRRSWRPPTPDRVVSRMTKADRAGRVFIDWSQNSASKTTAVPYTVRAREPADRLRPAVLGRGGRRARSPEQLDFTMDDVPGRVEPSPATCSRDCSTPAARARCRGEPAARSGARRAYCCWAPARCSASSFSSSSLSEVFSRVPP